MRTNIWLAKEGDEKSTADYIEDTLTPHMPKIAFGDGIDYESEDFKSGIESDKLETVNEMLGDLIDLDPRGGCHCVQTVGLQAHPNPETNLTHMQAENKTPWM